MSTFFGSGFLCQIVVDLKNEFLHSYKKDRRAFFVKHLKLILEVLDQNRGSFKNFSNYFSCP